MIDMLTDQQELPVFKLFGKTIHAHDKRPAATTTTDDPSAMEMESTVRSGRALVCPRCRSKETKFCYFNNYNVNQPRHFCRACHRYWTAGGALRNVPVGARRRKNRAPPHDRLAGC